MNYRKIEFDNDNIDKKSELLLIQIAKWHNLTPKLWIPDYKISTTEIEETILKIQDTRNEDLLLAIAEDEQGHT